MTKDEYEQLADRLEWLLDVGLDSLKADDPEAAILALQEALRITEALPQKKQ